MSFSKHFGNHLPPGNVQGFTMQPVWTLLALRLLTSISTSSACQCKPNCSLVLVGTVISKKEVPVFSDGAIRDLLGEIETIPPPIIPGDFKVQYTVKVEKVLKDILGTFTESETTTLVTSKDPEMCGVPDLKEGEAYLFQLFSDSGLLNTCDDVYPYEEAQLGTSICDDETVTVVFTDEVFTVN